MKQHGKHGKRSGFRPKGKPGERWDKKPRDRQDSKSDRKPRPEEKERPKRKFLTERNLPFDKPRKKDKSRFDKPRQDKPREPREHREPKERGPRPNLYGFHAVREAWLNPDREISALYITNTSEDDFAATLQEGREQRLNRPNATEIDKEILDRMLPRSAVHQGLAIIADKLQDVSIQDFIIKSQQQEKTILLMLDQVTDPHNVGAIIRSASAFGADGVIMQRKHAPELEGALAKTASGAVEHLPVAYETNLSRTLEELKENGFFVFGLDERGDREVGDILRNNKKPDQKIVLVLGAEGEGMRRLVRENCDELVRLPTSGPIQSLNVSNAAAVALYALCR